MLRHRQRRQPWAASALAEAESESVSDLLSEGSKASDDEGFHCRFQRRHCLYAKARCSAESELCLRELYRSTLRLKKKVTSFEIEKGS